ncbi:MULTISPECIES: hypothetical protein [unclassified Halomonas]|uniref:hypothetical protein n=1 Tax=unclassified Halomonas TaxID=2609666 RepID=UPI001BE7F078|nr:MULTISPECIES: hypothetical protein [unclassified Halomonas]MBT2786736.1 hypothetical protein [Halomonas sp. ISL-106]MBT2798612.1 hypothetical protein [Halomonas sp. ISL-104]
MEILIDLQKKDWKNYQAYIEKELPKQQKTWMDRFGINLVLWMIIVIFFMVISQGFIDFHWPTAILIATLFVLISVLFFFNVFRIRKAFEPLESGTFCGTHKFTFSDKGVASEGSGYKSHHSWKVVKRVEWAPGMILIYLDKAYAYVFPESKLDNPEVFYSYISQLYSNVTSQSSLPPSSEAD